MIYRILEHFNLNISTFQHNNKRQCLRLRHVVGEHVAANIYRHHTGKHNICLTSDVIKTSLFSDACQM